MDYKKLKFPSDSIFLVTGGAGFIGSNLCEALLKMGYHVRCLDDLSTGVKKNMDMFINNPKFTFIEGSITEFQTCICASKDATYILHQAAWGSVPRSIEMPLYYEKVNIQGTLNMMEAAKINNVKKFVYASSSSVYGDSKDLPKVEGKEGNVLSPYALTKSVCEKYGYLYKKLYNLDTYGLRYFNVFGRHQNPDGAYAAVIPKFIKCLLNDKSPVINGSGEQSRDFTYIDNVILANLLACTASSAFSGQAYNIAYGGQQRIIDVYLYLCKKLKKDITPVFGIERPGDIRHSNADISKAKKYLGYEPEWDFNKGIEAAIEWYIHNL